MNNSEHDPANPHSDNEDADRASHNSAADDSFHDSTGDDGFHDSGDDAANNAPGAGEDHAGADAEQPGPDGSAASPSEDEVWRDLVARLQNTESLPDDLEDTQPSLKPGEFPESPRSVEPPRPGDSHPTGGPADSPPLGESRPPRTPGSHPPVNQGPAAARHGQEHLGGPRDYTPEDEDDGYVPEDPPSLAGAEPLVVLAWIGAVGGPLALLLSAFIFRSIPMLAIVGIVAVFVASVVFLLWRLPSERGDDHDDGAIV